MGEKNKKGCPNCRFGQPCHSKTSWGRSAAGRRAGCPERRPPYYAARKVLADKVGGLPGFGRGRGHTGGLACGNALEQPAHVVAQGTHDLQAFLVLQDFFGGVAVYGIPVL